MNKNVIKKLMPVFLIPRWVCGKCDQNAVPSGATGHLSTDVRVGAGLLAEAASADPLPLRRVLQTAQKELSVPGLNDGDSSASAATQKARATRRSQLDVPYGDGVGEKMDIYFPEEDSKGEMDRASGPPGGRQPGVGSPAPPAVCYSFPPLPVLARRILAERKVSGDVGD